MTGYIILGIISAGAIGFAVFAYIKTQRTMIRMDEMVESAVSGTFSEKRFSEERMSRLESKMYRYINKGETGRAQIEREKENIESLISDISHQTKTPLANILLYTQLLSESSRLSDEDKKIAEQIESQTEKLSFLISSLVKTSRLETGIIAVSPADQDTEGLIRQLTDDYMPAAEQKNITLILGENAAGSAVFDYKWTMEALANIVDNAIKYTPCGGTITLSASEYSMFARIDISDTGIGMTEEETAAVFRRFYRSPEVSNEKGVGIGLYLAREILEREGGYIKVTSKKGRGSTFSVFLPKNQNCVRTVRIEKDSGKNHVL